MPDYGTNKKLVKKELNYIGRDFTDIRENLIEFAKSYFPTQYNDFNEASPGMMFVEMAAYVGDVLNYYVDNQFRETLIQFAEERKNVLAIAQSYGYKPRLATPSMVELTFTVDVPSKLESGVYKPDLDYAGKLEVNSTFIATNGTEFTLVDDVNFKTSSSLDTMEVEMLPPSSGTNPTNFRLKKRGMALSGQREEETFTFTSAKEFDKIVLSNDKVTSITSVVDSNNNKYYEVPFLAQDTVFEDEENTSVNDPELSEFKNDVPYLLKLIKTARRFTTYVRDDNKMELRFGSGVSDNADEELIPNPDNVGSRLGVGVSRLDESFDPSNFLKTRTFGLAPSNTTLTVNYNYGGAVEHNVAANSINAFSRKTYTNSTTGLNSDLQDTSNASLTVTNENPSSGGASTETLTEIKQNASAYFNAQNRAVTKADYITRVYSLPQKYGNIAKAYIVQDEQLEANGQLQVINGEVVDTRRNQPNTVQNPLALNMYLLGYNENKNLERINRAVKENVKIYCVDTFEGSTEHADIKLPKDFSSIFKDNLRYFIGRNMVNVCQGRSDEKRILDMFENNSIDYIMVDGAHEYDAVQDDILNWWPKLKENGTMVGDDYLLNSVSTAVKDGFTQLQVPNFGANRGVEQTWYCSKGNNNKVFEKRIPGVNAYV